MKSLHRNVLASFCLLFALFAIAVAPVSAQVTTGIFTGTVMDPQGAAVVSADVSITNVGTNYTVEAKTNADGVYRVPELAVGTYKITVSATGFKKTVKSGVYLSAGVIERVDFKLEIGAQAETVTVEAGAVMVQTEDSRLSETIGAGQVSNLPLNGRNVFDLMQLAPGALNVAGVDFENGHSTVVNGLRPNFSGFMINGVSDKGLSGGINTVPNADIVQEFQELTLNMSAQYGNSAAAVVNVVTKSGTNEFHGSAYEFLRNDVFDANDFFFNASGTKKPPLRFNQFGGTITGPVRKDHLFFTASFQGERFTTSPPPVPIQTEAPQWRQAIAAALPKSAAAVIYGAFPAGQAGSNPVTLNQYAPSLVTYATPTSAGVQTGTPDFTSWLCPDSSTPGIAAQMQQLLGVTAQDVANANNPVPNSTQTGFNPACSTPLNVQAGLLATRDVPFLVDNVALARSQNQGNLFNGNEWSARLDWVRKNDRVFGEFYWQKATDNYGPFNASSSVHGFLNPQEIYTPNFQFSFVHTFSPNWVNEFRAGYTRNRNDILTSTPGVPSIAFDDGSAGFGSYSGYPQLFRENVYTYSDMMTFVRGKHNIKAGVDFRRNLENSEFNVARPSYYFIDQLYFAVSAPYGEVAGVDPGFIGNKPAELATNIRHWRNLEMGAFVQDDWKVSRKLTLNLGLRYDLYTRHTEKAGQVTTFIPGPGCLTPINGGCADWIANANVPAGSPGCTTAQQQAHAVLAGVCGPGGFAVTNSLGGSDHNNFGPRAGFAYDPWGNGKTSIRGGFGVSYEGTLYNPLSNSRWNPPFYSFNLEFTPWSGAGNSTVVFGPSTCTYAPNPSPGCVLDPTVQATFTGAASNPGMGTGAQAAGNISGYYAGNPNTAYLTGIVFPQGIKDPYILNYYFGIQREILPKTVLEINYVGTQGHKLFRSDNVNRLPGIRRTAGNTYVDQFGRTWTGLGHTNLNPNYGTLRVWENVSKSWYDALQVTLRHQVTRGLAFNVNYAWSHSIDTGSTWHSGATTANGAAGGEGFTSDVSNPNLDRGNSIFDIRHRLSFNYVYEFPFHKDQKGLVGKVLGGWQYNGIWAFQSGAHFMPFCGRGSACDFNGDGVINDRPNAPNGNNLSISHDQWANGWFNVPNAAYGCAIGVGGGSTCLNGSTPLFAVSSCPACSGTLGRNTFVGPKMFNTDQSLFKNIKATEKITFQFRWEVFNAFNHTNFTLPNSSPVGNHSNRISGSGGFSGKPGIFGQSNGTMGPRVMQFALKLLF